MREHLILGVADSINSGAALIRNGRIIAAVNEERLSRCKMPMGWPHQAIAEVLRIADVDPAEVTHVAVATNSLFWRPSAVAIDNYFGPDLGIDRNSMLSLGAIGARVLGGFKVARQPYYAAKRAFNRTRRRRIPEALAQDSGVGAPVRFIDHHRAHAAGAYYTGGREDALVVTLDGAGDHVSATVSRGQNGRLSRVHAVDSYDSVGNYYSYVTHLLGFKAHRHEGKVTGLAALGEPIYSDVLGRLITYRNGSIHNLANAFHTSAIAKLRRVLPPDAAPEDLAASVQNVLEQVCVGYVEHWVRKTRQEHLILSGGVAANVKLNQRLLAIDGVNTAFVHPGMGDGGLAVGAALALAADLCPQEGLAGLVHELDDVYLGPDYSDAQVLAAVEGAHLPHERPDDYADAIARALVEGKTVAHFDGRMEYGPRALGNRSILVHAGDPTVNDWLNKKLNRTEFMPFAPVTLEEEAGDCYLDLQGAEYTSRFMTITTRCTPALRERCPAVVHVDNTARPQIVPSNSRSNYADVLRAYRARTGFSTIINTSFNMHEEPIVCTPEDAVRAFVSSELDVLAIQGVLVQRDAGAGIGETTLRHSTPRELA